MTFTPQAKIEFLTLKCFESLNGREKGYRKRRQQEGRKSYKNESGKGRGLNVSSWNVRTLVEDSGDPRICRKGRCPESPLCSVDRKFDFPVKELRRFSVYIAVIQETSRPGDNKQNESCSSGYTGSTNHTAAFMTVQVAIQGNGTATQATALLDSGSPASYVTDGLVRRFGLKTEKCCMETTVLGGSTIQCL